MPGYVPWLYLPSAGRIGKGTRSILKFQAHTTRMARTASTPKSIVKSYSAALESLRSGLGWVVAYLPFDPADVWGKGGKLKIRGEINGFAFRTSLFATREGRYFVLVNKRMQKGGHAHLGMMAKF